MPESPNIPDFTLLKIIGSGSYGDVWLARGVTGIFRAVKVVDRSRFPNPRPFLREFEGVTRFQTAIVGQPRQLALLHVGFRENEGILYYVMELADDVERAGEVDPSTYIPLTLKEFLKRKGRLSVNDCLRVMVSLAEALVGLHEAALIHRDIKPSNIIFVGGVPKLADIGLMGASDESITALGTPGYAPPEGGGTAKGDIFSLGKLLYQAMSGLTPTEFPRLPSEIYGTAKAEEFFELNEVVLKACESNPSFRYASARAMLDDLQLLVAGKSLTRVKRIERRLVIAKRFGLIMTGVAVVLVLLFATFRYQELSIKNKKEQYRANIRLGALALSIGDLGLARVALRRERIDPIGRTNGIELRVLWNATRGEQHRILGEPGEPGIVDMALSPDSQRIATLVRGHPYALITWDVKSGRHTETLKGCSGLAGFLRDGAHAIVAGPDGDYSIVELNSGSVKSFPVRGRFIPTAMGGDYILIAGLSYDDNTINLCNAAEATLLSTWNPAATLRDAVVTTAAVSSNGKMVAAAVAWSEGMTSKGEIVIRHVSSGESFLLGYPQAERLCFANDGKYLAIASENTIDIVSTETMALVATFEVYGQKNAVAFSPDGSKLAVAEESQLIALLDLSNHIQTELRGHEGPVRSLAWNSTGSSLFSGSLDGTLRVWNVGEYDGKLSHRNDLWRGMFGDVCVSENGAYVAATDRNGKTQVLKAGPVQEPVMNVNAFQPLTFLGGALLAITEAGRLVSVDIERRQMDLKELSLENVKLLQAYQVSSSRRYAVFGFQDGAIECWDLLAYKLLAKVSAINEPVYAAAISADGTCCAVSNYHGGLFLIDLKNPSNIRGLAHEGPIITSLEFSPHGDRLAVGSDAGALTLWNIRSGRSLATSFGHSGRVSCVNFVPDTMQILSAGVDGQIISWDQESLVEQGAWRGISGEHDRREIAHMAISATGERIAVMTSRGDLQLWDSSR